MHECLFYKAHASFSPPCEFTRFMHFFFSHHRANLSNSCTLFFTAVRTYQTHALFFSPPCELIKLMHSSFSSPCELIRLMHSSSFFHHRANLSNSYTLFQTAGIPTCILHMQEHCGSTEHCGRNLEILQRRKLCGTETLLGLLVWVRFQIKSVFIIFINMHSINTIIEGSCYISFTKLIQFFTTL